jgi:fluoride exporter
VRSPGRDRLRLYAWVAAGSALGGTLRFVCSDLVHAFAGHGFPWGTLTVNVLGSFAIGFYATLTAPEGRLFAGTTARQFVMAGVCGGYTTFSIFSLETLLLVQSGALLAAGGNVALSVVCWLVAVWLGHASAMALNR